MPRLNDHGLGGGGKSIGIPIYPLNNIDALKKDYTNGTWRQSYGDDTVTAPIDMYDHASCVYGNEIYVIGQAYNASDCYKYNVKTRVWTQLASTPTTDNKSWAVVVGTDIWYGANGKVFKYTISTNTHSSAISAPYVMQGTRACVYSTSIYIFGGGTSSTYRQYAYRFDTSNSTFTKLTNIPVVMSVHGCVYGTYAGKASCYLFNGTDTYVYSIGDDSYTKLATIPSRFYKGMCVKIDNYAYLINSEDVYTEYAYNMSTNVYTQLPNTRTRRASGHAGVIEGVIYMLGGQASYKTGESMLLLKAINNKVAIQKFINISKCYTDGSVQNGGVSEKCGKLVLDGGTALSKSNGAVTIPNNGEYVIISGNYATIEG